MPLPHRNELDGWLGAPKIATALPPQLFCIPYRTAAASDQLPGANERTAERCDPGLRSLATASCSLERTTDVRSYVDNKFFAMKSTKALTLGEV
jgi:hypothetical protein